MTTRTRLLLLAACALLPLRLDAQAPPITETVDSGTLIRMHSATGETTRGRLLHPLTPATTLLTACRYPGPPCTAMPDSTALLQVPMASLVRIDRQRGSHWARGAGIGGLAGAALGLLVGATINGFCDDPSGCGPDTGVYALVGAAGFGVLGGLIGDGSPTWREIH